MLKYSKITVCRPNTRFLMDQTSDFVNRSGSLEMDFRFIQNKDFETQDLFVPCYLRSERSGFQTKILMLPLCFCY